MVVQGQGSEAMVRVEAAGSVINGVHHDDSTTSHADRVQDRRQGLGKQVATEMLAVEFFGESESGQEEAWNRSGAPRPTEEGTSSRRMPWGTTA